MGTLDYFQKKELIEQVKELPEPLLLEIFRLIKKENPSIKPTGNFNGIFIKMDELSDNILSKIAQLLKKSSEYHRIDWERIESEREEKISKLKKTLSIHKQTNKAPLTFEEKFHNMSANDKIAKASIIFSAVKKSEKNQKRKK